MQHEQTTWTKEDDATRTIAMPNHIFKELKEWTETGVLKSAMHQEFVYSYYWLIAYLWRYAKYTEFEISQKHLKRILGYNETEKRLDYIIKKNGVMDKKGYTGSLKDFPIEWNYKRNTILEFLMWSEMDDEDKHLFNKFSTNNFIVKAPILSLGNNQNGLFWDASNSHMLNGRVFQLCMTNNKLACAGFYLCGLFTYIRGKEMIFKNKEEFSCSNREITQMTNWSERRIIKITNELQNCGLINKEQPEKRKGCSNTYQLNF